MAMGNATVAAAGRCGFYAHSGAVYVPLRWVI